MVCSLCSLNVLHQRKRRTFKDTLKSHFNYNHVILVIKRICIYLQSGACSLKVSITFWAWKAVLCLLCLHSGSKFQYFWKWNNEAKITEQIWMVCELGTVLLFNRFWFQNMPSDPKVTGPFKKQAPGDLSLVAWKTICGHCNHLKKVDCSNCSFTRYNWILYLTYLEQKSADFKLSFCWGFVKRSKLPQICYIHHSTMLK